MSAKEVTAASLWIGAISAFILSQVLGESFSIQGFANWHVSIALIFGILQNIWVPLLVSFAFTHINEVLATQVFLLENFFAVLFGYFLYQETANLAQLFGAGLIIASVYRMNQMTEDTTEATVRRSTRARRAVSGG